MLDSDPEPTIALCCLLAFSVDSETGRGRFIFQGLMQPYEKSRGPRDCSQTGRKKVRDMAGILLLGTPIAQ